MRAKPAGWKWALALAGAVLAHAALAGWLFAHPALLPSDDSLFFARGLRHFSVLEFSPHFPGYPGFVLLGRLLLPLAGDPAAALFLVSNLCALAIPAAAAWVAWRCRRDRWGALIAYCAALAQPLLPALGLSLLSDSAGVLFLLLFFGALAGARGSGAGAGAVLAAAACCRPSYAVMILAALAATALADRARARGLILGFAAVCALAFGAVLALEGMAYIEEGLRFTAGHATLWGNTVLAGASPRPGWGEAIAQVPGGWAMAVLGGVAVLAAVRSRHPAVLALAAALAAGTLWTLLMQNPENLRHLAPLTLAAGVLALVAPPGPWSRRALGVMMAAVNLWALLDATRWPPSPPPLAAAAAFLATQPPGSVVTNHGVALMRRDLDRHRVLDAFYAGETAFALSRADGPVWRVSAAPLPDLRPVRDFPARFLGENGVGVFALH